MWCNGVRIWTSRPIHHTFSLWKLDAVHFAKQIIENPLWDFDLSLRTEVAKDGWYSGSHGTNLILTKLLIS